jgi:ribose-phosphate pyrophosphokinase|nr:MAG TPA: Baseplate wedge protein [Caudoviricetes sp.]
MISIGDVPVVPVVFPDGTQKIDLQLEAMYREITENKTVYITWLYESDKELFSLYCISKNIREHFPQLQQDLMMPYIPNARFDRVKYSNECFTLKYFAEIINSLGFVRVIVTDPHSDVSTALINHVEVIRGASYITQTCSKILKAEPSRNLVIYFPDSGSLKRYSEFVSDDYPIVYGIKNRDWKTGKILGIEIHGDTEKLDENTAILMIDDICSKGGTFYYGSKELNKYGCKDMYLYVTHCENTILDGELLKEDSLFKKVFTTRSIFTKEHEKVEVLDL